MKDKTILITGATNGIGKAAAIDLAHRGAELIIVGRNIDTTETTKYEIAQYTGNDRIHAYYADMSLVGEVINLCHQIKKIECISRSLYIHQSCKRIGVTYWGVLGSGLTFHKSFHILVKCKA